MYFAKDAPRTTFFFTNFPENFFAKHMLKSFLHYGEFEEVIIPAKRDKLGKRFGFARAVNVKEPERFVVKLDNIIIGSEKIMVNMPRFPREHFDHPLNLISPNRSLSYHSKPLTTILCSLLFKLNLNLTLAQPTLRKAMQTLFSLYPEKTTRTDTTKIKTNLITETNQGITFRPKRNFRRKSGRQNQNQPQNLISQTPRNAC